MKYLKTNGVAFLLSLLTSCLVVFGIVQLDLSFEKKQEEKRETTKTYTFDEEVRTGDFFVRVSPYTATTQLEVGNEQFKTPQNKKQYVIIPLHLQNGTKQRKKIKSTQFQLHTQNGTYSPLLDMDAVFSPEYPFREFPKEGSLNAFLLFEIPRDDKPQTLTLFPNQEYYNGFERFLQLFRGYDERDPNGMKVIKLK